VSEAAERRIAALPLWSGRTVRIAPLTGGLSNANFTVDDGARRYMVRVGDDLPFHHVDRVREVAASQAAHSAGLSPAVVHAEPGLTVFDYVEGRAFTDADVRADRSRVLDLVRTAHRDLAEHLAGPGAIFWVFHVIRDYAATLRAGNSRMTDALPGWLAAARRLEAAQVPLPIVFGHHDLLPANILDDGRRLWLIDWEYGAFGTALFDLANLAGNAGFQAAEEQDLLGEYFGRAPEPALLAAFAAMKAASLLREAMWSMVSELRLDAPGVDYVAYTELNLARFRDAYRHFEDMIR
jgi:thiamine kinase-like enzyme